MPPTAILFPGQGSLTADAGPRAHTLWPELVVDASELLGEDPFERAAETTASAQPAIFVASLAAWRESGRPLDGVCAMAGHSLGELTALAAAGALAVDDALRLVVLRGRLMALAADARPGGTMLALLGGDPEEARLLATAHGVAVANDNAPGQLVLSGDGRRLRRLVPDARAAGFKTMELDVTGAFHSPAMRPAVEPFLEALRAAPVHEPQVPVISGCTAQPFADVRAELADALVMPVRWREVMGTLVGLGAREFADVGPGRVLARLVKRNVEVADVAAV
jgi:malonyl CoA-acyl carrier protein transacylase